jgi:hypothetical protein
MSLRGFRQCSWGFFYLVVVRLGFIVGYRHFGTAYWSILQRSSSPRRIFFLDSLTNVLDQNICNQLPTIATQHDRRTKAKYISHWLFKKKIWQFPWVTVIFTDKLFIDSLLYTVALSDIMDPQFHWIYMLLTTDILDR